MWRRTDFGFSTHVNNKLKFDVVRSRITIEEVYTNFSNLSQQI